MPILPESHYVVWRKKRKSQFSPVIMKICDGENMKCPPLCAAPFVEWLCVVGAGVSPLSSLHVESSDLFTYFNTLSFTSFKAVRRKKLNDNDSVRVVVVVVNLREALQWQTL